MANPFYSHAGAPGQSASLSSATIRGEFDLIQAAFDLMPVFTGNANKIVVVNGAGTGLTVVTASPVAAGTLTGTTLASNVTASSLISGGASFVWGTGTANFGTVTLRKTADQSVTSSVTPVNDTHLNFSIAANEEWAGQICISAGAALSTTGALIDINTPAGATVEVFGFGVNHSTPKRSAAIAGTLDFNAAAWSTADGATIIINFWILNGANAGTVNLQWAQSTSSATALTFRKGSRLQAIRVA